ncbi:MAG: hypothetical protein ACTSPY_08040 [Candidatus Helarchaeota archaeon]
MNLKKINFKMVLNISAWLFLILTGVWAVGIVGPIDFEVFSAVILLLFLIMAISSFGFHSYLKENPENQVKYFIEWLFLFVILVIIGFTTYIFA